MGQFWSFKQFHCELLLRDGIDGDHPQNNLYSNPRQNVKINKSIENKTLKTKQVKIIELNFVANTCQDVKDTKIMNIL
jgi:hypothetical protein